MCRNCGAIVGGGQRLCAVCGKTTSNAGPVERAQRAPDPEALRFARAVLNRPNQFTIIFLVANLFLFLLMWNSSGMSASALGLFPEEVLIAYGAKLNFLIRDHHQWWRFVTPMFLHVNLVHLLINMYSLWVVGPYVEKLYGSAKFVVFWVLTGVAATVASYLTVVGPSRSIGRVTGFILKAVDAPSAGASGALFGLVGVLFVFGIKFRHELPEGFKRAFGTGLLPMILLNLFIGYAARGLIDNAAHLGGFVMGAVLALFVDYRRPDERRGIATTWRLLKAASVGLVMVSFALAARHFRDPLPVTTYLRTSAVADPSDVNSKFISYVQVMNEAQEAFYVTLKDNETSRTDAAIRALESTNQLDAESVRLRDELKGLLTEAKATAVVDPKSESAASVNQKKQELIIRFSQWSKQYNSWLKTSGRQYGGLVDEP